MSDVPWIDPDLEYVAVSELHVARRLAAEGRTCIITKDGKPFAVLVPYATYLQLQSLAELPKAAKAGGKA